MGRRLLDQLQERVPGGIGELVCLVKNVDLRTALDRLQDDALADFRMSSIPRWEAASISITSSDVPAEIEIYEWQTPHGSAVGPFSQLTPFARIRASDVLPVPREPANK